MSIELNTIDAAFHSIQIKDAAGDALAISAGGAALVEAVDLDIRNLVFATDKVDVGGSVVALDAGTLAALESITVVATDLDIRNLVFATDKVDVSGSVIETVEGGYDTWKVTAETVDTTVGGVQLVATPLASRLRIILQNLGSQDIYIKNATGVTTSNGLKIPKGTAHEIGLDAGAQIWAITPSGTSDIRTAEYAA